MQIQKLSKTFIPLKNVNPKAILNKIQNHISISTVKNNKINYKALFLAGLLTAGSFGAIGGCASEQAPDSAIEVVNIAESAKNVATASKLKDALIEKGDELTIESAKEILNNFFKQNSIENVEIDDINNPKIKDRKQTFEGSQSRAAFWNEVDENLNAAGGTMYITHNVNFKDNVERALFIDELVHESTHALQTANKKLNDGLENIDIDSYEIVCINLFTNTFSRQFRELYAAISAVRNGAAAKFCAEKLTDEEYAQMSQDEKKYETLVSDKIVEIDDEFIKEGVCELIDSYAKESNFANGGKTFEQKVNYFADLALDAYIDFRKPDKSQEKILKKALLTKIIYIYRNEIDAYTSGNNAFKASMGMDESKKIISDFTPKAFDLVADILEEKLEKEFE